MLQTDSIQTFAEAGVEQEMVQHHYTVLTPAQVISWLPKDATPAQQDSAVQSRFSPKILEPSQRPDTLHMPGIPFSKYFLDSLDIPLADRSVFKDSPFFSTEIGKDEPGVPGEAIPYSIAGDNIMTSLLLLCFIITISAVRNIYHIFIEQLKSFFFVQHSNTTENTETSVERRSISVLVAETSLLLSLVFFFYIRDNKEGIFVIDQYLIIGIFVGIFAFYFIIKYLLYGITNSIFFEHKKNQQLHKSRMFLQICEGLLLLPVVYVQSFFDLDVNTTLLYTISVLVLIKLLTFYKQYIIFFGQKGEILQNILYFCMLELSPLSILWGVLMCISAYLKVKY